MRLWCIHFGRERNAKKNENLIVKIQQAAATNFICSSTWYFLSEPADKKNKKKRRKNWRSCYRSTWYTYHIKDALGNHNKLEAGPAAKGRDNEGQMRRSHVCFFGFVATCDVPGTCPTQKLPLFLNLIQMGPRKTTNLLFRRSPDRGGIVLTSSYKTEEKCDILQQYEYAS